MAYCAFGAIILYFSSAFLMAKRIYSDQPVRSADKHRVIGLGLIAIGLHGWVLFDLISSDQGMYLNVSLAASLVGWLIALILSLAAFKHPLESLAIFIYPAAGLALLVQQLWPDQPIIIEQLAPGLRLHILFSIVAYSLLSIAALQALLLAYTDSRLKNHRPGRVIRCLPALQTMEILLFRLIGLGFICLTLSLLSGLPYVDDIFGQHLIHKTVLSISAWFIFAILLWGRLKFGWRGRTAINFTLSGMFILLLAYFGSKFVLELILHRV